MQLPNGNPPKCSSSRLCHGLLLIAVVTGCARGTQAKINVTADTPAEVVEPLDGKSAAGRPVAVPVQHEKAAAPSAEPLKSTAPKGGEKSVDVDVPAQPIVVHFEWSPIAGFHGSYSLSEEADQHRIVFPKGMQSGRAYPVVIGFHGQPKQGKDPRNYGFLPRVQQQVMDMVDNGEIEPVILVLPVFRFLGTNWPAFDPALFVKKVEELLAIQGVTAKDWYAFGHSGAAGCGGDGLNQIHRVSPKGVGFFDTCLGETWQKEVGILQRRGIATFNIHSVETAGFKPRQRPEYQSNFDFGRAYGPLGIEPVTCPRVHPGKTLRPLPYRCSATTDGVVQSFVVDTGEGEEAHTAVLEPAITYFLKYFLGTPAAR